MADYPTTFDTITKTIDASRLSDADQQLISDLAAKGYEVHGGLTPEYADEISKTSLEPSIKEYCPRDSSERFANRSATKQWLAKGRIAYLLLKKADDGPRTLAGYGWAGAATSDFVPGGETTFALRVAEAGQGQGLATPFARLILVDAYVNHSARRLWLETWASNAAAVHIYSKLGFEDIAQQADERPTAQGETVPDTRLYMSLNDAALSSDS